MQLMRRRIALGVTGVALLGAAGGAYATTRPSSQDRDAVVADAAKRLNVTPQRLSDALQVAAADQLDAAVKAGRLTRAEADAIEQRAKATGSVPFLGGGHGGFGPEGFGHGAGLHGGLADAAKYLGLTEVQLLGRLRSGKSLAEVAKDQNKDAAGLERALEQAVRDRVQQAVKDGRLTQAEADAKLQDVAAEVQELVQRSGFPAPGFGPARHGFGGPGFGGGAGLIHEGLRVAADYLGLTPAKLRAQLAAGTSLADVAKAQGKTAGGLAQRLVAVARTRLDAAVKAKRLTRAEADRLATDLRAHIDAEIQESGFGPHHRVP